MDLRGWTDLLGVFLRREHLLRLRGVHGRERLLLRLLLDEPDAQPLLGRQLRRRLSVARCLYGRVHLLELGRSHSLRVLSAAVRTAGRDSAIR
jgi:hypothetical protein